MLTSVHEGQSKIDRPLSFGSDRQIGNCQIGFAALDFANHSVPFAGRFILRSIRFVFDLCELVAEIEQFGQFVNQIDGVSLVSFVAILFGAGLFQHRVRFVQDGGHYERLVFQRQLFIVMHPIGVDVERPRLAFRPNANLLQILFVQRHHVQRKARPKAKLIE